MSNLLGSLKGKLEVFRRRGFPGINGFGRRHPVERVVDLDTVQLRGVIRQELFLRESLGIEAGTPFLIAKTRRAEPNPRHSCIIAKVVIKTLANIGGASRLARKTSKIGAF